MLVLKRPDYTAAFEQSMIALHLRDAAGEGLATPNQELLARIDHHELCAMRNAVRQEFKMPATLFGDLWEEMGTKSVYSVATLAAMKRCLMLTAALTGVVDRYASSTACVHATAIKLVAMGLSGPREILPTVTAEAMEDAFTTCPDGFNDPDSYMYLSKRLLPEAPKESRYMNMMLLGRLENMYHDWPYYVMTEPAPANG